MVSAILALSIAHASMASPKVCSASVTNVGIFGGYEAFLLESGDLWFRDFYPPGGRGLKERRYHLHLDADGVWVWDLGERIKHHQFFKLKDSTRREIPDEGAASIVITPCGQRPFTVRQLSFDRKPAFQIVLDWFLIRWETAKAAGPVYDGEIERSWTPPP